MELSTLKAFIHIAEGTTFREAAERENMSQASVSRAINNLEKELDISLFYREHRTVRLTEAGNIFYDSLHELIPSLEHALDNVRLYSRTYTLSCCVIPYKTNYEIEEISYSYCEAHPGNLINLTEAADFKQVSFDLEHGQLDFVIMHRPFIGPFLYDSVELIKNDSLIAILPRNHILARRSSISLRDLREEPILTDEYMNSFLQDICYSTGCTLQTRIVSSDSLNPLEALLHRIAHGRGISICFESSLNAYRLDRVALRKIRELPTIPILLVYPKGKILNINTCNYIQYLKQTLEDLQKQGSFF